MARFLHLPAPEEPLDEDPMAGVANLFDVSVVFIVGLMITLFSVYRIGDLMDPESEVTLVKNLRETELVPREYRNTEARFIKLTGERRLQPHLSELPPLGRSVNHRHTTEAVIYIIKGSGYSTIGYDDEVEQKIEWEEGDLFGIPLWAWHQHLNTSETETVRYLAVQDTFMIKALGLHQIERHPRQ